MMESQINKASSERNVCSCLLLCPTKRRKSSQVAMVSGRCRSLGTFRTASDCGVPSPGRHDRYRYVDQPGSLAGSVLYSHALSEWLTGLTPGQVYRLEDARRGIEAARILLTECRKWMEDHQRDQSWQNQNRGLGKPEPLKHDLSDFWSGKDNKMNESGIIALRRYFQEGVQRSRVWFRIRWIS